MSFKANVFVRILRNIE
jgi:hypothetical protein